MSLLGKIFVVVVTVLSLLFLGVQATLYHHAKDWREAYQRTEKRYQKVVQFKNDELKKSDANLEESRRAFKTAEGAVSLHKVEIKSLEDKVKNQTREQSETRADLERLQAAHDTVVGTIREKDSQIKDYLARIQQLEGELKTATTNQELAEAQVARLLAMKTALEKDVAGARTDLTKSQQEALDLRLVIEELERLGIPVSTLVLNHEAVPPLRGIVAGIDTSTQPSLVLLTVGQEDGVKRGYTFTVYRGNKFVGQVVVTRLMADSAGCRVIFTAPGETIKQGDQAATRLE